MDKQQNRSGLHSAALAARAARAAVRILKGAAAGGVYGAAAAAAKEAAPFAVKIILALLVVALILPLLVFTAIPNMFFGYASSNSEPVMEMTQQAMTIGGAYLSLQNFESTQIDSLVTGIVNECENDGTTIDRIEVTNALDKEDLLWLIAINSVYHEQNLNTMSASDIRLFCSEHLQYTPSLIESEDGDHLETTLQVEIRGLDPYDLMRQLGFHGEAVNWAEVLYETLEESNALEEYGSYFESFQPDYSGDGSYNGDLQHGNSYGNEIDISKFISPDTKNNLDLAAYVTQAWEHNWGYVWGTYGNVLTDSLFQYKLRQYPDGVGNYEDYIREHWLGRRTADCVGLIKGYGWLDADTLTIGYATNGMPDYGADQMYQSALAAGSDHGPISSLPEIPGLAVWKSGHIGVYIGDGYVIEAMSTKNGVVKTEVTGRGWEGWCKLPFIDYLEEDEGQ